MAVTRSLALVLGAAATLLGCGEQAPQALPTVAHVDLPRFMGDWYVIANIPTSIEKHAYLAKESYRLAPDGSIATTFTYRAGAFDGPEKRYTPRGFVTDTHSNAVWGMRFVWPIKADYRIAYLSEDYSQTLIARNKRDYLWIMARTPHIPEADLQKLIAVAVSLGYERERIQRVPQR
jgi:apolipoprotein D and lipocalin family protein